VITFQLYSQKIQIMFDTVCPAFSSMLMDVEPEAL